MKKAVALTYDASLPAPFISAKASGMSSKRLLALAGEHGIPIVSAPDSAEVLFSLDVFDLIPEDLYEIIADILVFIQKVGEKEYENHPSR
ncbi:MAG: hypothetical protein EA426_08750 [Spirochaetaceae bacterium]|nr:MAG: hypothetical protein EA426_08750 [Spirochaetaceae bacterium]